MGWVQVIFVFLRAAVRSQAELAAENLVLRQQLAVLAQGSKRPRLRNRDRIFWTWFARLWSNRRSVLVIVQRETVIRWHKQGFRLYWRWKSRSRTPGRPKIDTEIRKLIRRMSLENPLWGTPRIRSELRLLGYEASKATVDTVRAIRWLCIVRANLGHVVWTANCETIAPVVHRPDGSTRGKATGNGN